MAETFNERLVLLRRRAGLTQIDLTQRLEQAGCPIGRSYISELERTDKLPSGEVVRGLALALDTSADYLLFGERVAQ